MPNNKPVGYISEHEIGEIGETALRHWFWDAHEHTVVHLGGSNSKGPPYLYQGDKKIICPDFLTYGGKRKGWFFTETKTKMFPSFTATTQMYEVGISRFNWNCYVETDKWLDATFNGVFWVLTFEGNVHGNLYGLSVEEMNKIVRIPQNGQTVFFDLFRFWKVGYIDPYTWFSRETLDYFVEQSRDKARRDIDTYRIKQPVVEKHLSWALI